VPSVGSALQMPRTERSRMPCRRRLDRLRSKTSWSIRAGELRYWLQGSGEVASIYVPVGLAHNVLVQGY
jgi:hypothetical protein